MTDDHTPAEAGRCQVCGNVADLVLDIHYHEGTDDEEAGACSGTATGRWEHPHALPAPGDTATGCGVLNPDTGRVCRHPQPHTGTHYSVTPSGIVEAWPVSSVPSDTPAEAGTGRPYLRIDRQANAGYVYLRPPTAVARTEQLGHHVAVDLDEDGVVIGYELLNLEPREPTVPGATATATATEGGDVRFTTLPDGSDVRSADLLGTVRDVLMALEHGDRGEALSWADRMVLGNQLAAALKLAEDATRHELIDRDGDRWRDHGDDSWWPVTRPKLSMGATASRAWVEDRFGPLATAGTAPDLYYPGWPSNAELEVTFRERIQSVIEEVQEEQGSPGAADLAEAVMDELGLSGDGWVTARTPRHPHFLDPVATAWTLMTKLGDAINHRSAGTPVVLWVDGNPREVTRVEYDEDVHVVFVFARREIGWGEAQGQSKDSVAVGGIDPAYRDTPREELEIQLRQCRSDHRDLCADLQRRTAERDAARAVRPVGDVEREDPTGAVARMRDRITEAIDVVWSPGDDDPDDERAHLIDAVMAPIGALMERHARLHLADARLVRRLRDQLAAPLVDRAAPVDRAWEALSAAWHDAEYPRQESAERLIDALSVAPVGEVDRDALEQAMYDELTRGQPFAQPEGLVQMLWDQAKRLAAVALAALRGEALAAQDRRAAGSLAAAYRRGWRDHERQTYGDPLPIVVPDDLVVPTAGSLGIAGGPDEAMRWAPDGDEQP